MLVHPPLNAEQLQLHCIVDPFLTPGNAAAPSIHWVSTVQQLSCPLPATATLRPSHLHRDGIRFRVSGVRISTPCLHLRGSAPAAASAPATAELPASRASPMQSGTRAGSSGAEAEQLWERANRSGVAFRRRRSCPFSLHQNTALFWGMEFWGHQHAPV